MTLIGHVEALDWLRRAVASDRLAHAYLLSGPRGVGRRTFALEIAQALNCLEPDIDKRPDHTCQQCRLVQRGVHPDVRLVRRAPERRTIAMRAGGQANPSREYEDNVEFIQADAQLRPLMGRRKVYVIVNAEELAEDAANRLLKTLEEPPPFVVFLLTAVERGAVLPTIVSRCQEIRLRPAGRDQLAAALVETGVEPERAAQLAALSGGRQAWALNAAHEPATLDQQQTMTQLMLDAIAGSRLERLLRARTLSERWTTRPEEVRETLRVWLRWWRDVVLVQLGLDQRVMHVDQTTRRIVAGSAAHVPREDARAALLQLQQALADLDANVNHRLVLDLLLLRLPRVPLAHGVRGHGPEWQS